MPLPAQHVYLATLDQFAKFVTWMVGLIFFGQAAFIIVMTLYEDAPESNTVLMSVFVSAGLVGVFYLLYLYRILRYELNADGIRICRPLHTRLIPYRAIVKVNLPSDQDMKWTLRLFANGGVFGYYGMFTNSNFGRMSWYASRRKSLLILELKNGEKIVLTPDDMSMAEQIQSRIPITETDKK